MKNILLPKILLFTICIFSIFQVQSQQIALNRPYLNNQSSSRKLVSFDELPSKIKKVVEDIILESLHGFKSNLVMASIYVNRLDSATVEENNKKNYYRRIDRVLPAYQFTFKLHIPALQNPEVFIALNLDSFGQVLEFTWPRYRFSSPEIIKEFTGLWVKAIEYAKAKGYHLNKYTITLVFDKLSNSILYRFSFEQGEKLFPKKDDVQEKENYFQEISFNLESGNMVSDCYSIYGTTMIRTTCPIILLSDK